MFLKSKRYPGELDKERQKYTLVIQKKDKQSMCPFEKQNKTNVGSERWSLATYS